MSCAVDFLLKDKGLFPGAAAGHSLGEFSALVSAEALTFEQGLKLVKLRGELMQKASEISPGTMAAIIGLEAGKVEEICASTPGTVTPANYNSPGQLVISGEIEAVEKAMSRCLDQGAKIVKKLLVSGAFHSPLMETACTELFQALEETEFSPPKFPVYHNVTSEPAKTTFEIRELLKKQLLNPVKWEASIRNMLANADTFLEVGPGNVLSGLMKRIEHNVKVISVKNMETLNSINLN
jgi:[acyl-carrier-protein] S-malonyltransferase